MAPKYSAEVVAGVPTCKPAVLGFSEKQEFIRASVIVYYRVLQLATEVNVNESTLHTK